MPTSASTKRVSSDRPDFAAIRAVMERDLARVHETFPRGLTSKEVVQFFQDRGVRLSEATFRKYVQLGLLPRSKRVGRKGRHKGSTGIYPVKILHRIWRIRELMEEGYTIEEIKRSLMRYRGRIDDVEQSLAELFGEFERELDAVRFDSGRRKAVRREMREAREMADSLLSRLEELERLFVAEERRPTTEEGLRREERRFF